MKTERQSETMKLHFEYVLSDETTPKLIEALENQITLIRNCDIWRKKHSITSLSYDITKYPKYMNVS